MSNLTQTHTTSNILMAEATNLLSNLPKRLQSLVSLEALTEYTAEQLSNIKGIGPKAIVAIQTARAKVFQAFKISFEPVANKETKVPTLIERVAKSLRLGNIPVTSMKGLSFSDFWETLNGLLSREEIVFLYKNMGNGDTVPKLIHTNQDLCDVSHMHNKFEYRPTNLDIEWVDTIVESFYGEGDFNSKVEISTFVDPKRFTKEVQNKSAQDGATLWEMFQAILTKEVETVEDFKKMAVETVELNILLEVPTKPKKLGDTATDAEKEKNKESWALYRLQNLYALNLLKEEVVRDLLKGGRKLFVKVLKVLYRIQAINKKSQVIINSFFMSLSNTLGKENFHIGGTIFALIQKLGLVSTSLVSNREGHQEMMVSFIDSNSNLKTIYKETNSRFPNLFIERANRGIDKRNYNRDSEPLFEAVNYLQSIPLSLVKEDNESWEDVALKAAEVDAKGEDGTIESWVSSSYNNYLDQIEVVNIFGHFYDKFGADGVGRLYSEQLLTIQSKAVHGNIAFANKKPLNDIGKKYLKILIVDEADYKMESGLKPTEEEALNYFENNKDELAIAHPKLFSLLNSSEPTGFIAEVDGQTQGAGIYGLLSGDLGLLSMTGFVGNTFRSDFYLALGNTLNRTLNTKAFTRAKVKSSFMTKGYGAGFKTIMFGDGSMDFETGEYTIKPKGTKQVPLMQVAEEGGIFDTKIVWNAFKRAMKTLAPQMLMMQQRLEELAEKFDHTNRLEFTMPDGLVAIVEDELKGKQALEMQVEYINHLGTKSSIKHKYRAPNNKNTKSAAPRKVQAVDAYILRFVVLYCKMMRVDIMVNHDGYFCHPNDIEVVMEGYKKAASKVASLDLLTSMAREAFEDNSIRSFRTKELSDKELNETIMNSKYSLYI